MSGELNGFIEFKLMTNVVVYITKCRMSEKVDHDISSPFSDL